MNRGVRRIFVLVIVLFLVLMGGTARWTVFESDKLDKNDLNGRLALKTERVPRGTIRAADGTLLAKSVKQKDGTYVRHYTAAAKQASQLLGYAYTLAGLSGMEKVHNDDLTGKVKSAATLLSAIRGSNTKGDDVISTLEPKVQQAAITGLNGRVGAAVAIDTKTGGILAMASNPGFDPNDEATRAGRKKIAAISGSPSINRATAGQYPPGSTMKVVTTAAALASGKYTPDSTVSGTSPLVVQTKPLSNFHGEQFPANITLTDALTNSVNTAFARVAEDLGANPIADMMKNFGFNKALPVDAYGLASGVRDSKSHDLLPIKDDTVDIARVAIGQERLAVTPLQMAFVAATIARGGDKPRLSTVQRVVDPDGRTLSDLGNGHSAGRAVSQRVASQLTAMMEQVVKEGTGTAAALSGLRVAGKTGSAEVGGDLVDPWFIGFAPAEAPRVAVAVMMEKLPNATGGVDAAPIAKAMMEAAL
ncbi:MAG: penicillin-binding protein 2 [Solirubrobacteraceae bacterium]|nr:penicillin-binding protein 2 [Patulibacter sp.]